MIHGLRALLVPSYTDIKTFLIKCAPLYHHYTSFCSLQAPLPSPSSPGGRRGWREEHHQQHLRRQPRPGGRGRSWSLPAPAAGGGGRRGLLWAVRRSESGQHHGLGLGHLLLPLLLVPRQRGPLWKQRLSLPGQWKQVRVILHSTVKTV